MNIRLFILSIFVMVSLAACKENKVDARAAQMAADPYCASFDQALNGVFKSIWQEGSMVWKGGTKGTVEIIGADFNEMTCEFEVISCEDGQISMLCNGSVFNTSIDLYSPDSIKINQMVYVRVSEFTVK